jgi:DNA-binding MarR family transcriptional regulator
MSMAARRLSRLQTFILLCLEHEHRRTRDTMAADHSDLIRYLTSHVPTHKRNISTSLKSLERKGLVTIVRTPCGQAETVALTSEGHTLALHLARRV